MAFRYTATSNVGDCRTVRWTDGNRTWLKAIYQSGWIDGQASHSNIHSGWKSIGANQCTYSRGMWFVSFSLRRMKVNVIFVLQWNSGNLLTLGWSDAEELLCVQDDGLVLIYNMFGQYLHAFSMGQEAKDTKIVDAKIFASNSGTGVAVMTTNFRIFLINSIKEPKNRLLPEMPSRWSSVHISYSRHSLPTFLWFSSCRIHTRSNVLGNHQWRPKYVQFGCTWAWSVQTEPRLQCVCRAVRFVWKWISKYRRHVGVIQSSIFGAVHKQWHRLDGHIQFTNQILRIQDESNGKTKTNRMVRNASDYSVRYNC